MTLKNTRATFEKAVTDAVLDDDPTISMVYDNLNFNTPGQEERYVVMNVNYSQATLQPQGAAIDYYSGVIQCNIHVPNTEFKKFLRNFGPGVTHIHLPVIIIDGSYVYSERRYPPFF